MSILSSILLAPVKREFIKHICGVMRKCSYTMAISKDLGRSIFKNFFRSAPTMVAPRGIRPPQTHWRSYAPAIILYKCEKHRKILCHAKHNLYKLYIFT